MATFSIANTTGVVVQYITVADELVLTDNFEIEFLFSDGTLRLVNNFPNPYNNLTVIPIVVPQRSGIRLDIYNSAGAIIQTVLNDEFNIGYYEIPFNASGLASGVYLYRMVTDQEVLVKKMLLMK